MLRSPEAKGLTCQSHSGPQLPHLFREGLKVVPKDPPSSEMLGVQQLPCNRGRKLRAYSFGITET